MRQVMITTNDNPFDPFEDWYNWFNYDVEKGYYSCSKLDRIIKIRDDFTELEVNKAKEKAIDEIIKYDFTDKYQKAVKEYSDMEGELVSDDQLEAETNAAINDKDSAINDKDLDVIDKMTS